MNSLNRCQSLEPGMQRMYNFTELIKQLQHFLFNNNANAFTNDTTIINSQWTAQQDPRYFFYGSDQQSTSIKQMEILKLLLQIKKTMGKHLFLKLELIKTEITQYNLSTCYLKFVYGLLKMHSISQEYITRQLIWIYSLCFGTYDKEPKTLRGVITKNKRSLVLLGMHILSTQDQKIKQQLSYQQQHDRCFSQCGGSYMKKPQKQFKKCMIQYIKFQQQRNHEQKYQICRICQSHISINLMHAHLAICQTINQKDYLQQKILQSGKQLLQMIKQQVMEYDYLDERADTKLFFNRVYERFGEKNVVFAIKQDQMELGEVIEQFRNSHNLTIKNIVDLLKRYRDNVLTKIPIIQGYQSDDYNTPRVFSQQRSRMRSSKFISRHSIRISSNSLNFQDSDSRSTGSQKLLHVMDQSFTKSAKAFHTIDGKLSECYRIIDFAIIKLLGKGAYSEVYLVRNTITNDLLAMKVVQVQTINSQTLQALRKQQQIYKKISSQFAIKLYQSFSDENLHFFLLQYANGGNLRHLLQQQCYFDQNSARLYLANLILALQQIHHMGIIHRDLKPENIVIDSQGFLKLTDFNLAFMLTANQQNDQDSNKFFGSPDYIAPQVIKSQLNHPSRDIWSLGIIAYQIMIGVTPFTAMQVQQVFQNILRGQIEWPQVGNQQGMITLQAKQFIQALLDPIPETRLGFSDIGQLKSHIFFKNFNWTNIRQYKPFFIPQHEDISLIENRQLKKRLLERRVTEKSSTCFPSLGNIIRYDILKSKSSLKAKSTRKSRFKMEKQLNQLKILTSMDCFPPVASFGSQKLIGSNPSSSAFHSQNQHSTSTLQLADVSYRSIQPGAIGTQRNQMKEEEDDNFLPKQQMQGQRQENYEIKIISPENKQNVIVLEEPDFD